MHCPSEHRVQGINLSSNLKYPCYSVWRNAEQKKNLRFCWIFQCSCLLETSIKEKSWIVFFFSINGYLKQNSGHTSYISSCEESMSNVWIFVTLSEHRINSFSHKMGYSQFLSEIDISKQIACHCAVEWRCFHFKVFFFLYFISIYLIWDVVISVTILWPCYPTKFYLTSLIDRLSMAELAYFWRIIVEVCTAQIRGCFIIVWCFFSS